MAIKQISGGFFAVLEGIDGCGKTTQIPLVAERLRADGYSVVTLRAPGSTEVGETIRSILREHAGKLEPATVISLLIASNIEMLEKCINPALRAGQIVLCDRYIDSMLVYQVGAFGYNPTMVFSAMEALMPRSGPDYIAVLTLTAEQASKRLLAREHNDALDKILSSEMRRKIVDLYEEIVRQWQSMGSDYNPAERIDASASVESVTDAIYNGIINTIAKKPVSY